MMIMTMKTTLTSDFVIMIKIRTLIQDLTTMIIVKL